MTTTTTAPPQTLDEAKAAVIAARDKHEALHNKIVTGDTSVTAAKLSDAAAEVIFVEARLDAAVAAEEARQAAQHEADLEAVRAEIAAFDSTIVETARANYAAAVEALTFMAQAIDAHEDALRVLQGRAAILGIYDESPNASLRPKLHNYAELAVQDATGRLREAHALSSDVDAAAASEAAAKAGARSSMIRVRRDLWDATASAKVLRSQAETYAKRGDDAAADDLLSRAARADADVARLTAELARLEALAA